MSLNCDLSKRFNLQRNLIDWLNTDLNRATVDLLSIKMAGPGMVAVSIFRSRLPNTPEVRPVLARFARDANGAIGVMFGLMILPLVMALGMASDLGRMISVRNQTQIMVDSAALAGGRAAQLAPSDKLVAASKAAKAYFTAQIVKHSIQTLISESANGNAAGTAYTWTVESWVRTPFISAASIRYFLTPDPSSPNECKGSGWFCRKVSVMATAVLPGGTSTSIETALMLDVTGSMAGTKITDLKAAAKDLIDIVVWDEQGSATSRVALAPFAEAINVGATLAPQVRGTVSSGTNPTTDTPGSGFQFFKFTKKGGGGTSTFKISTDCVTERTGFDAYTDASPTFSGSRVGRLYPNTGGTCSLVNSTDPEVNSIQPLSSDKTVLKRRIDKLAIAGSTAGQLGTAWAWYLLSPNWNSLFPLASAAASYTAEKNRKIAVLMTDGEYNTEYWNGVEAKTSNSADANFDANNSFSELQAPLLCTEMKKKGIEVFTIGFQVTAAARTLLTNCATNATHYYDATSGEALRQAFRDIALKISSLRLSQ